MSINYSELVNQVIYNGFFSEYLPKVFSIKDLMGFTCLPSNKDDFVEPYSFNMSRFSEDEKRRTIYIPELASYIKCMKYVKDNDIIAQLIEETSRDRNSFSPIISHNGRLTRHEVFYNSLGLEPFRDDEVNSTYMDNMIKKINLARGAIGILAIDIANYYRSIYTHIIPCIVLGIEKLASEYKLYINDSQDINITKEYRVYQDLDKLIRGMNGGRTNGILPGLLISQIIAEALLSRIDNEIRCKGIKFVRYVDDYEIFIYNEKDKEKYISDIANILNKYYLTLNHEKTKYTDFPYYVAENIQSLIPHSIIDNIETVKLFNTFFTFEKSGTKGAVRFLVKSLQNCELFSDKKLLSSYLINILVNNDRSLIKICEFIIHERFKLSFSDYDLELINSIIKRHIDYNHHLEVIWLLYMRIKLQKFNLRDNIIKMIITSDNDLAKIIIIEEYRDIINRHFKIINTIIDNASSWILYYDLFINNYISEDTFFIKTGIKANRGFYRQLKRNKISIYKRLYDINNFIYLLRNRMLLLQNIGKS